MNGYVNEEYFFFIHDALVLMTEKYKTTWMKDNNYFQSWLLTMNVLQNGTHYDGHPVVNSPEFMPLDNILNIDIFHSLHFHCVLSRFVIDGEGTNKEDRDMRFSFSTPKENFRGLNCIWESKMGTTSSARIIQDVDLALKALGIFYLRKWG